MEDGSDWTLKDRKTKTEMERCYTKTETEYRERKHKTELCDDTNYGKRQRKSSLMLRMKTLFLTDCERHASLDKNKNGAVSRDCIADLRTGCH